MLRSHEQFRLCCMHDGCEEFIRRAPWRKQRRRPHGARRNTETREERREKKEKTNQHFYRDDRDEGAAACQTLRARLERIHTQRQRDTAYLFFERDQSTRALPFFLFPPVRSGPQFGPTRPLDFLEPLFSFFLFHTTHSSTSTTFTYFFFFFLPCLDRPLSLVLFRNGGRRRSLGATLPSFSIFICSGMADSFTIGQKEKGRLSLGLHRHWGLNWMGIGADVRLDGEGRKKYVRCTLYYCLVLQLGLVFAWYNGFSWFAV
jgi:hypothetical protein